MIGSYKGFLEKIDSNYVRVTGSFVVVGSYKKFLEKIDSNYVRVTGSFEAIGSYMRIFHKSESIFGENWKLVGGFSEMDSI